MNRTLTACALLVFLATTAACGYKVFEPIGSDPHPPTVEIIQLVHYVPPVTTMVKAASPVKGNLLAVDTGFTVTTDQLFQIKVNYTDAGGDLVKFSLHDLDGKLGGSGTVDFTPAAETYFPGTSGTVLLPTLGLGLTGIAGRHRMQLWAEDSHLSRSEKVDLVINLII